MREEPHFAEFTAQLRACIACDGLPLGHNPLFQLHPEARVLIAGQAPGRITHQKGRPFDDPSGDRLRDWLGIDKTRFYTSRSLAMLPMGLCFPGSGKSGDLPPRAECAIRWRAETLARMPKIELTLVFGRYAIDWHLPALRGASVTQAVTAWRDTWPRILALPHPSPRNNRWLAKNPWVEREIIPALRARVAELLPSQPLVAKAAPH
ncbi:MAG: uracil-DNA glycosylase family protein [Pseudomonadota bacterium]